MQWLAWRYQRFHTSYLLAWLAVGVLVGIASAQLVQFSVGILWYLAFISLLIIMFHRRRWWSIVITVAIGVVLGVSHGTNTLKAFTFYESLVDTQVQLTGVIADDPVKNEKGQLTFVIGNLNHNGKSLPGTLYVTSFSKDLLKRGYLVELKGKLSQGFGSYQGKIGYASVIGVNEGTDPIRDARDGFAENLRRVVDEPAASLGLGFVVGQRSSLPEELDDDLRIVGLTHIVVTSGYNLTILVRFARRMLEKHSKYLAASVSAGAMLLFTFVSGFSPSMTRASIVTGLSLAAWYYGRRFHPLQLILLVAAGTAFYNPVYLWADIGWYLSFLAFAGVLIISPMLIRFIFRERTPHPMVQVLFETTAAQLMTLPLILMVFGELPVLALVSNVLVAAVIPLSMALTAVTGVAAGLSASIATIPAAVTELVLGYVLAVVAVLSTPDWSQVAISISPIVMVVSYIVITAITYMSYLKLRFNFRSSSIVD